MTEREQIIKRLNELELCGGSHEMLSSIAKAISPDAMFGWTQGACNMLRARLVNLLSDDEAYLRGYDEGFASADDALSREENGVLEEHGWYRALCADRKPMLLGDRMEWVNGTFTIHELKFTEGGCTTWDSEHGYTVHADECRHYHAPTVEDVLQEFAQRWDGPMNYDRDELVEQYAAKLRLAGDAE